MSSTDGVPRPDHRARSPWLVEALAAEGNPPPAPAPARDLAVDVAIVGGGYTGLWTALQLAERDPRLRVAVLEQDICGSGPSGRNGGFVNAWWDELATLVDLFGDEGALACAREVAASVHEIGAWCARQGVDAHYRRSGMLLVSTTPHHDGRWRHDVALMASLGLRAYPTGSDERIAVLGGRAVGIATYFPTFSTFLGRPGIWLEDLFVRPAHRGSDRAPTG